MTQDIEQRLEQDATAIKTQAASRLRELDLSLNIEQLLHDSPTKSNKSWLWGMAAAIGLSFTTWLIIENNPVPVSTETQQLTVTVQNVKSLPHSIEEKVNKPLVKEQQAIIEDLKSLKAKMFSI